jgi:hypothetical protein
MNDEIKHTMIKARIMSVFFKGNAFFTMTIDSFILERLQIIQQEQTHLTRLK